MADIAVTAAQVAPVYPNSPTTVIRDYTCHVAVTIGQSVYGDPTTGKVGLADANDAGKEQFLGIALSTKAIGETVKVLERGEIYGFDLSGVNYFGLVYQGDTAGTLSTTASGTKTVDVGKCVPVNDFSKTKILYVQGDLLRNW